jgi:ornithine carbamoyltransferase
MHDVPDRPGRGMTTATASLDGHQLDHFRGRSLLKVADLTADEFHSVIDLAALLRTEKRAGTERRRMAGRNIALIFEKASTRTRAAFEVGAFDQGAQVTYFGPEGSHIGESESIEDTARVLGRMYDGIEFRGFAQESVEILARHAGVPVWNGLTDEWHPTQMLADILTMRDHSDKPLDRIGYCYLGDARNNTANSLLVTGALLGMDVRIAAPEDLWPTDDVQALARALAQKSGARIHIGSDVLGGVEGADFLYTDVWVSMGEPVSAWDERIKKLLRYQVTSATMAMTGNPDVRFMHCLPSLHDTHTALGRKLADTWHLDALEVTDEVFESPASIVFDQAENRLHTIKAVMVASIGD